MNIPALKIGTRGSPLALAQTRETRARLAEAHGVSPEHFEIVIIRTSGDVIQDRALSEAGGKGLFTRELDLALIAGEIDFAVHSSKDLPTELPPEIVIAGYLPREDARDAFIGRGGAKLSELPQGAVIGTASLRRAAQVKRFRADLTTVLLRGNVETRLAKVESGAVDGTLLALAGLRRLGLAARATEILPLKAFLPAAGQGAVGVTCRGGRAARLRGARADSGRCNLCGALRRARLSQGARRLLPHADRRLGGLGGRRAALPRRSAAGRRNEHLRSERGGPRRRGRFDRRRGRARNPEGASGRRREPLMRRALVLRAREDAQRTAKKLAELGFDCVLSPVLEIVGTGAKAPAGKFDAVIVTSAKALEHGEQNDSLRGLPLFVVGARTAALAERLGWRIAGCAPESAALLSLILGDGTFPAACSISLAVSDAKPSKRSCARRDARSSRSKPMRRARRRR